MVRCDTWWLGCKKKILEYFAATNRISGIFRQLADKKFRQIQESKAVWAMEVGILRETQKRGEVEQNVNRHYDLDEIIKEWWGHND